MAAATPEAAPTFNWTGMGHPQGAHIHYQSFNFAGQHYTLGDYVYLLPEEEGSPPYIARLVRAYEDTTAKEAERLVIEVGGLRLDLPPCTTWLFSGKLRSFSCAAQLGWLLMVSHLVLGHLRAPELFGIWS